MKLQDFRVALRILVKDPLYSLVAILGLAVGVSVCVLLLGYARYSWQYNAHVPDVDNIYIVKHRNNLQLGAPWFDQAPMFLHAAAKTAPGVKSATAYVGWAPITVETEGQLRNLASLTVLPGFAEMMGLRTTRGDLNEALTRPDAIAITEKAAMRLFGTSDVLGRTVLLRLSAVDENRSTARIAAILHDPPANTTIPFETLNGPNLSLLPQALRNELLGQSSWMGYVLVRVESGTAPESVAAVLQRSVNEAPGTQRIAPAMRERLRGRPVMDIELSRLRDAYFDREVTTDWLSLQVDRGDRAVVSGLIVVAVLILALAAVNYVNLVTIRTVRRQREIAMRKVLGARRTRLLLLFVAESVLASLLATVTGLLLAAAALPMFAELMERDMGSMISAENAGVALCGGIVLGLLTAIYPTRIAFGVRPSLMLMGRPDTESMRSKRLRQVLSVLQVAAAMGLASFTLAISWQTQFAIDASPGFDPSPLLIVDLPTAVSARDPKARGLVTALSRQPEVAGVAISNDAVGRSREIQKIEIARDGQAPVTIDVKSVSPNFFDEFGLRPSAGRLFDPTIDKEGDRNPIVINAIAARQLGFSSPELALEQSLIFNGGQNGAASAVARRIIGIAPEVRFYSLRERPGAVAYQLIGSGQGWAGTLTIRAAGSAAAAEHAIRNIWPQYFPNSVVDIKPAKESYAANYADDARIVGLLGFATLIAMLISAFGIYVLSADAVHRRTKEIALRKLFGGRGRDVGKLVAKDIGTVLLVSTILATPVAALAIARHLAAYTQWTSLTYWALAFVPLVSMTVAAVAGSRQAWIAMRMKPAVALGT